LPLVAFQGERGAFGEEAINRYFGPGVEPYPCRSFADVFAAVSSGRVDFGLVPVENSQAGSINDVYDLLRQHDLFVTGEVCHPVDQCLMALPGQSIQEIKRVISHPQALAQCDQFLRQLGVEVVATYDTAGSAKMIREQGLTGVAAIAGAGAAALYGLELLARAIQTVKENVTRFVVLSRTPAERRPGPQKTMLVMAVDHRPGSLYAALGTLARREINLLKLESRPSRNKPWEYVFYLDFEGHREDPLVREALAELAGHTTFCKVLGSFPADAASSDAKDGHSMFGNGTL
jgi:prephenate dehydratase